MKGYQYFLIGLLSLFIFFLLIGFVYKRYINYSESFQQQQKIHKDPKIQMYVITLRSPVRIQNIQEQQRKIPHKIDYFDAFLGENLNFQELLDNETLDPEFFQDTNRRKREIGCYMSHLMTYHKIREVKEKSQYSVIFEDDFMVDNNFMETLLYDLELLKNTDFDILYLGNLFDVKGTPFKDNIYKASDEYLWGAHGYVINNKNIDKIINKTKRMYGPIDQCLGDCALNKTLDIFLLHPCLVNQSSYQSINGMKTEIQL